MKIGFIGLGKLGLPVALAVESKGHEVKGYDINPAVQQYLDDRAIPFQEADIQPLLDSHNIQLLPSIEEVCEWADIVFCAVQTPHDPKFEGVNRHPEEHKDFDYSYLVDAVSKVRDVTLVVISTCLPGTFNNTIQQHVHESVKYVYNPFFIAMGTVLADFLNPEFVLVGQRDIEAREQLEAFYKTIHDRPLLVTDITTAEAIKVSYNTIITAKTVIANVWAQIAEATGADMDDIYKAWSMATDRIISPRYLQAGMSDGGGCHPRDNTALAKIADDIDMSFNFFDALMYAREAHEQWIAEYVANLNIPYPVFILGKSFKPETNITTGSPAILLANILEEMGVQFKHYDPYIDTTGVNLSQRAIWVIATKHARFAEYEFQQGSVVIDPFGIIEDQPGVDVRRLGRR